MNLVNAIKRVQDFEIHYPHQAGQANFYRKSRSDSVFSIDLGAKLDRDQIFYYIVDGKLVHKLDGVNHWFYHNPEDDCPSDYPEHILVNAVLTVEDLVANDWVWEV